MKKKAKKPPTHGGSRAQGELAGMRPKKYKDLEDAMSDHLEAAGEHQKATQTITNAKRKVFRLMEEHGEMVYGYRGRTARITETKEVEIKSDKSEKKKKDK